jgi:uncharacterized membrane protein
MRKESRTVALLLAAFAAAALLLAMLPSLVKSEAGGRIVRAPFALLCHQIAERSVRIAGEPMSLCARCSGIFAGIFTGSLIALALRFRRIPGALAITFSIPLLIDGITQASGLRESFNGLRFATGIVAAAAAMVWVLGTIASGARESSQILDEPGAIG